MAEAEKVDLVGTPAKRIQEAAGIVFSGLTPFSEAGGTIFRHFPVRNRRMRQLRHLAVYLYDELHKDKDEKKEIAYGN